MARTKGAFSYGLVSQRPANENTGILKYVFCTRWPCFACGEFGHRESCTPCITIRCYLAQGVYNEFSKWIVHSQSNFLYRIWTYTYHYMLHQNWYNLDPFSTTYGTDCSNILLHVWKQFDILYYQTDPKLWPVYVTYDYHILYNMMCLTYMVHIVLIWLCSISRYS